jgi:hypothetical protein
VLDLPEDPALVPQPVCTAQLIDASPLIEVTFPEDPERLP